MKLYKYVPAERATFFEDRLVRFTQPSLLNDPFELSAQVDVTLPLAKTVEIMSSLLPDLVASVNMGPKSGDLDAVAAMVVSLTGGLYDAIDQTMDDLGTNLPGVLERRIGVFSLSETATDRLMWAHYAEGGRGFVIEFDTVHPFFNTDADDDDSPTVLRQVLYTNSRPHGAISMPLEENDTKLLDALLFTKPSDWAYEREWRVIGELCTASETLSHKDGPICLFEVPTECITGVVFGQKMPQEPRDRIIRALAANDGFRSVTISEVVPVSVSYEVEIHPISRGS